MATVTLNSLGRTRRSKGKGKLSWDWDLLQPQMSLDAWAEAEGWLASLHLLLAREVQAVLSVHTAFCLCHGGISPELLPQLSAIHFGVAALLAAFTGLFPNNTSFAVVSDQLFSSLCALNFGLGSTAWARSL